MKQMNLVKQIRYVRKLLDKAESDGNIRLARQYVVALYHLNQSLYISIEEQSLRIYPQAA